MLEAIALWEVSIVPDEAKRPVDDSDWLAVFLEPALGCRSDHPSHHIEHSDVGVVAGVVWSGEERDEVGGWVVALCLFFGDLVGVVLSFAVADGEDRFACGDEV